jgi:predicted nucleotidyltransferase
MDTNQVIEKIRQLAFAVLPSGSSLWLYGSRARGDNHENSDWDLLVLLDKSKITASDYDLTYPFRELGWNLGIEISPHVYSRQQWNAWTFLPFYKNVERDKIVLV